jgi:predicted Zn-dependent protease
MEMAPDHRPSRLRLSWALALDGQHDRAAEALGTPCGAATEDAPWQEYAAMLARLRGDVEAAARCYERLRDLGHEGHASGWTLARAAAAAGRQEEAVDWLEQAGRRRSSSIPFMLVTPAFDSLHGNARFRTLGQALGLPAAD